MRRLAPLVAALTLAPGLSASAAELNDLLEESSGASYTAEQTIVCSTPDGVRDAVVRIAQSGDAMHVSHAGGEGAEVSAGDGGWVLSREGGVISSASVEPDDELVESLYVVEDLGEAEILGRQALAYRLVRDGLARAELVIDDETGVMVATTTFTDEGTTYCQRRFIAFEPGDPEITESSHDGAPQVELTESSDTSLPETVAGFERLDLYEDELGFRFAYYSDGFFSFAVFDTPSPVMLRNAVAVELGEARYRRSFGAGQATYVWEAENGGMALVGDLPPDLHQDVLQALPEPDDPGLFRRLWRTLFG